MPETTPRGRGRPPKDPADRKVVLNARIDRRLRERLKAVAARHFAGFQVAAHEEALRLGLDAIEARRDGAPAARGDAPPGIAPGGA